MATYEEKLTAFARGQKLLRLPRPLRNRADAFCDACGSTRPRTLCALKDWNQAGTISPGLLA